MGRSLAHLDGHHPAPINYRQTPAREGLAALVTGGTGSIEFIEYDE